jgi:hypothetical protein
MGHLFTRLLGPHLCPKSPNRPLRSNGGARGSEIKNSHPLVLLQNPSHFSLYPTKNTRERECVCVRRCTGGAAREPLCRCTCSSEIERAAIEWPCGRSLSGPRPSPVTDDMKNLMSDSEPAMVVPEELLEAWLRVTPSNR